MRTIVFSFMLFLALPPLFADTVYYRSDWVGVSLEPIDRYRVHDFEYVLSVKRDGKKETRILLHSDKDWKRWETLYDEHGAKTEEFDYEDKVLVSHVVFDNKGRLKIEYLYEKGALARKKTYAYSARGLDFVDTVNARDERLYTDEYELSPAGRLRSMRRVFPDNTVAVIHFTYAEGILVGEWEYHEGRIVETVNNENGQPLHREEWNKDELLSVKDYTYDKQSGKLVKETEKNLSTKTKTDRTFDADGNVVSETTTGASGEAAEITYTYEGDRKKTMRKKSGIGVEEWKYYYNADGSLAHEDYYRRGLLEMRTTYTDADSRYEEIFRDEAVIIRVFYHKQKKVKEEFIQDGKVVRTKEY
jgi:YD repeat-containing protein